MNCELNLLLKNNKNFKIINIYYIIIIYIVIAFSGSAVDTEEESARVLWFDKKRNIFHNKDKFKFMKIIYSINI